MIFGGCVSGFLVVDQCGAVVVEDELGSERRAVIVVEEVLSDVTLSAPLSPFL